MNILSFFSGQGVKHLPLSCFGIAFTMPASLGGIKPGLMKNKRILIKGRVDSLLKDAFLKAWRQFNRANAKNSPKTISRARFLEILVTESLDCRKRNPATQPGKFRMDQPA